MKNLKKLTNKLKFRKIKLTEEQKHFLIVSGSTIAILAIIIYADQRGLFTIFLDEKFLQVSLLFL